MQLTKLDHWLKQRFVYQTHIFCLRLPEERFPKGVSSEALEVSKLGAFKYKLIIKDNDVADSVIELLKSENIMHSTRVVDGKSWLNKWVMPDAGKSFTFQMIGRMLILLSVCSLFFGLYQVSKNEELMSSLRVLLQQSIDELNVN